jgi:hypothetical protein
VFQEEQKERVKNMKHFSITVKIDCPVRELVVVDTIGNYITKSGLLLAITKENDDNVFCLEFCIDTNSAIGKEIEKNILSLLQYIVVGL